jgi:8-oxo-dGTP pyrophosphatase MutT (NUDIX family)
VKAAVDLGVLERGGARKVFMSVHESQAWQVAHRQREAPRVLVIDASRAQRAGVHFNRSRQGLWQAKAIPSRFLLNTLEGYGEQVSAGGFPLYYGDKGPELLLIRVRRRSGVTWEVAKGKLEPGETPWQAAIREVQEEVGREMELSVAANMGFIRYGFRTPDGSPRLKTVHIYLLKTSQRYAGFEPASLEGIEDVDWFTPEKAVKAVSHRSLRPMVWKIRRQLESGGLGP